MAKLLLVILILAAFLRLYDINTNPKAMYGDELTLVYDAYSISLTGRDQKGEKLPLVFQLGAARPPGYVYATVPFAYVFGPTAYAARLPSILSGIGMVFLLYLITKRLFNKETGILATLMGAISPWGISLSRGGFETNFALFLALFGVYAFLRGPKAVWLITSSIAFAISMQTYSTYRMILPLFATSLFFINFGRIRSLIHKINKPIIFLALAIFLASIAMSFYLTFSIGERDRFSTINIFQDPTSQALIAQTVGLERYQTGLPKILAYAFHNKYIELTRVFLNNYMSHFSFEFLFLNGDGNPRHNPTGMGQLYFTTIIPLIIALAYLYKTNRKTLLFLICWILVTPIAASLVGQAHALRSTFMLPPLLILTAVGIYEIFKLKGKYLLLNQYLIAMIILVTSIQFIYLLERVYLLAPGMYASFWSYPAKQAALRAYQDKKNFDFVVLSNDIPNMEYAYPTYNRLDPYLVMAQNKQRTKLSEYLFFKYENVYIGSLPKGGIVPFLDTLPGSALYIGPVEDKNDPSLSGIVKDLKEAPELIRIEKPKPK